MHGGNMSDLVSGLKAGDCRAFERLVGEYGDRVHRFVARLAGLAAAEDLTQEVFLRVHRSIGLFNPSGRLAPWIFTIANNLCIDHLRRQTPPPVAPEGVRSPVGTLEAKELRETLLDAVARLPEEQRRVFHLREDAGLTFREIAQVLGCPLGTALGRMHGAMQRLRRSLGARLEI
jgi:RNA polymerase sigma-70 factor (ECF subfamily)